METGAAELGLFDEGGSHAELGRADGGDIAAHAAADDDDVIRLVRVCHRSRFPLVRCRAMTDRWLRLGVRCTPRARTIITRMMDDEVVDLEHRTSPVLRFFQVFGGKGRIP